LQLQVSQEMLILNLVTLKKLLLHCRIFCERYIAPIKQNNRFHNLFRLNYFLINSNLIIEALFLQDRYLFLFVLLLFCATNFQTTEWS
jgi:hypothetical protein